MKPTPVSRFYFSLDEVTASLFPSGIPSKSIEMRVEGDELVVDFVSPTTPDMETVAGAVPPGSQDPESEEREDFPGDSPSSADQQVDDRPPAKVGPNEQEARDLCSQRGFQTFLDVRTEEAAVKVLLNKCRAPDLRSLDTEKYKKAAFRDIVGEYEVWLRG